MEELVWIMCAFVSALEETSGDCDLGWSIRLSPSDTDTRCDFFV